MTDVAKLVRDFYADGVTPELAETCLREEMEELVEVLNGHAAYPAPINGGYDGYEAACHDCGWRSGVEHQPGRDGKSMAREDAREHIEQAEQGKLLALARELSDVVWTAFGHAEAIGVDLDIALQIIGQSNMAKLPDCPECGGRGGFTNGDAEARNTFACADCHGTGKGAPLKNPTTGKIERPPSWIPPDLSGAIL
jgi:hypothetical protein